MSYKGPFGDDVPPYNRLNPFLSSLSASRPRSNSFLSGVSSSRPSGGPLFGILGNAFTQPQWSGTAPSFVVVSDLEVDYTFEVFPIFARPRKSHSLYIFGRDRHWMYYAGIAENLFERLSGHERMLEAIELGANELWVHTPGPDALVDFRNAERRLIGCHGFPLNKQHNEFVLGSRVLR